jgi:hypothetical protein
MRVPQAEVCAQLEAACWCTDHPKICALELGSHSRWNVVSEDLFYYSVHNDMSFEIIKFYQEFH